MQCLSAGGACSKGRLTHAADLVVGIGNAQAGYLSSSSMPEESKLSRRGSFKGAEGGMQSAVKMRLTLPNRPIAARFLACLTATALSPIWNAPMPAPMPALHAWLVTKLRHLRCGRRYFSACVPFYQQLAFSWWPPLVKRHDTITGHQVNGSWDVPLDEDTIAHNISALSAIDVARIYPVTPQMTATIAN